MRLLNDQRPADAQSPPLALIEKLEPITPLSTVLAGPPARLPALAAPGPPRTAC
jgi:hypothetical protein